jgi:pilus assembly protein CpaB
MSRGLRTAIVLAVALVAALAASYVAYIGMQRVSARSAGPDTVPVVVAARPVPMGTLLTADHVRVMQWPASSQVDGAVAAVEHAVDRGTIASLAINEPVTEAKLAAKGIGSGLSPTISQGMRAISIKVNEVVGVAGFVVPGSRVDVLVTIAPPDDASHRNPMTRIVVSNAQVLTAGTRIDQDTAQAEGKPIAASVVTLAVAPADAERLALAQNQGQITLTLRNPLDTDPTATPGVRLGGLLGSQTESAPAPQAPAVRRAPRRTVAVTMVAPAPAPRAYTVEAIRGAKRTEETIK